MRASTLAVATLSVLAAQGICQTAQATDAPTPIDPVADADQVAVNTPDAGVPEPVASQPEPDLQPQFAMTRLERMLQSESAAIPVDRPVVPEQPTAPATASIQIPVEGPAAPAQVVAQQALPVPQAPASDSTTTDIPVVQVNPADPGTAGPTVEVAQTTYRSYGPSGVSSRRLRTSQLNYVSVTNRSGRTVEIELVGRTRPLVLFPGQTRQLAVRDRDLSLLYWVPTSPERRDTRLAARVSQTAYNSIAVTLVRSNFPSDNLAIYFPEPNSPDYTLKVF